MRWLTRISLLILALLMAGCFDNGFENSEAGEAAESISKEGGAEVTDVNLYLNSPLAAGGQLQNGSTLAVTAVLSLNGSQVTTPTAVTFSSTCSRLSPPRAFIDPSVLTHNGEATAVYRSAGCQYSDLIVAEAQVGERRVTAEHLITLADVNAGDIEFVSAEPEQILLSHTGGQSQAQLTFVVEDALGNPLPGQDVAFELASGQGRVELLHTDTQSDSLGRVTTTLIAGTLPGPVRVQATVTGSDPVISAVSSQLIVGSGLPDQNSFSLSSEVYSTDSWYPDHVEVVIGVIVADHFNNPVPDGTAVSFIASGGTVGDGCLTEQGICSVSWLSSDPRPANGRVTVLAWVEGEESFQDLNGNGLLDQASEAVFTDMAEAYLDVDESQGYTPDEPFIDRNYDGSYTQGNDLYDGVLCDQSLVPGRCSGELVDVHRQLHLVMSGRDPQVDIIDHSASHATVCAYDLAADGTHNPLPAGASIAFSGSSGVEFSGETSFDQQDRAATIPDDGVCIGGAYTVRFGAGAGEWIAVDVTTEYRRAEAVLHL